MDACYAVGALRVVPQSEIDDWLYSEYRVGAGYSTNVYINFGNGGPAAPRRESVAPLWHTIVFVVFVCGYAFLGRGNVGHLESRHITTRLPLYLFMLGLELLLVAYVGGFWE